MRATTTVKILTISALSVTGLGLAAWSRARVIAAPVPAGPIAAAAVTGGYGGEREPRIEPAARIYLAAPVTAEAAATWAKLQMRVSMPFANETPLEDVLRYIKEATATPAGKEGDAAPAKDAKTGKNGLNYYVDPLGLQEAEKTMSSPVTYELEGVPLSTSLEFILRQLGLRYSVRDDGLVVIDSENSPRIDRYEAQALILDQLAELRKEVKELRAELTLRRPGASAQRTAPSQPPAGAMGGGFR